MRTVALSLAMSLDGYLADRNGGVDWLTGDGSNPGAEDLDPAFYQSADTVIMGWNTYHQIITELSPNDWPYQGKHCYVLTHRTQADRPGITFLAKDPAALINTLKQQPGNTIWICGGASLIQQLMKADAIDAYCFSVIPTMLGDGIRLFPLNPHEMRLTLVKTRCYNGITDFIYQRHPPSSPSSTSDTEKSTLLNRLSQLHTTPGGAERIQKNLNLGPIDVVAYCRKKLLEEPCTVSRKGKNWYCLFDSIQLTIHTHSCTIITAHKTT